MKTAEFENFLRNVKGLGEGTIGSRLSNCRRLEDYEGDLDRHVDQGSVEDLLERLDYSTEDQRRNARPLHRVPINGNVRTGTATLRSALRLYIQFRQDPLAPTQGPFGQIRNTRTVKPAAVRSSRGLRPTTHWPNWEQAGDTDILQLARVLTPLVRFLHPDVVAAVVDDNRERLADWRTKFEQIGVEPDIYLWDGSPCAFPGVRRYAGSQEIAWYRKRTTSTNFTPKNCLRLDDNDYPKHLWAFVLTGSPFRKKGPDGYQLAHLADHKEHKNRWRDEFDLDASTGRTEPPPLFGLYTSPANTAYVPKNFLQPTDVVYPLRALLLRRAFGLYGGICRLVPPPLVERPLVDPTWNPDRFDWCDPVGDMANVREFLEYRQDQVNRAFGTRSANMRARQPGDAASTSEAAWESVMALATEALHDAMAQWAALGLRKPEVGFELADQRGQVLAEAELAWPPERVAVLEDDRADARARFAHAGWRVYSLGDGDELVEGVARRLGA